MAALRSTESERLTNLSTSLTPTGWINVSIDPPEVETSFEAEQPKTVAATPPNASPLIGQSRSITTKTSTTMPNGSLARSDSPPRPTTSSFSSSSSAGSGELDSSLPRKGSGAQLFGPPRGSVTGKTVHTQIWKGLVFLASDPCSKVAENAQYIVHSVHDKVGGQLVHILSIMSTIVSLCAGSIHIISLPLWGTPPPPPRTHTHTHTHTHTPCSSDKSHWLVVLV